jgi:hypothetical protein
MSSDLTADFDLVMTLSGRLLELVKATHNSKGSLHFSFY